MSGAVNPLMRVEEWVLQEVKSDSSTTSSVLAKRWNHTFTLRGRATSAAMLRVLRELEREGRVVGTKYDMGRGSPYRWRLAAASLT